MKISGDKRLWLDKADRQTTFALYPDQRFYAVAYPDADEEIQRWIEMTQFYSDWCKEAYGQVRQGLPAPEFPEALRIAARTTFEEKKEAKASGKTKTTKAHSDQAEG